MAISPELQRDAHRAFTSGDAAEVRRLLTTHAELRALINDSAMSFGSRAINNVRTNEMLDVLIEAGADLNTRSDWEPGGFCMLETVPPGVALYAISKGAAITVHGAARLGLLSELRDLVTRDPQLVHARGGDGKTALHYASTTDIAKFLLDSGADIEARDIDHSSTPAQYLLNSHPDVARYLIAKGCHTDILMAAALNDRSLAENLLHENSEAIRTRVSDEWFPMIGQEGANGGTIYQWELGWHVSAVQVARRFGHSELAARLMEQCPAEEKLLNACWLHDESLVTALLAEAPHLADKLLPAGRRQLAHAARNNDTTAVRLMLNSGLPVDARSQHNASPLHWAGFHGNAELIRLLLSSYAGKLEDARNDYAGTPLNWAICGSREGWFKESGDYASTVELLLDAGAVPPSTLSGSETVQTVLRRYRVE